MIIISILCLATDYFKILATYGSIFFFFFLEKANTIVNALIRQGLSHTIGCVVIDEMHVLGDKDRGYHLEILVRCDIYLSPS
jgi:hypothetical protein